MKNALSLLAGILFGLGLALSKMIDPTVVIGFLDVAGSWDPSLMFVMIGALSITTIGYYFAGKKSSPICDNKFHLPTKTSADKSLIGGATVFGIGWGLAGYCPGPAIGGLALGQMETVYFVVALTIGVKSAQWFTNSQQR